MKKIIYSVMMLAMAAFTFTSCEDVPMPYDMPGYTSDKDEPIAQLVGDGTVENPYNVASALYLITEGKTTDEAVAVEGIISQIDEIDTGSFGNATYYISDDGTTAKQLQVYRGYYLNGARFKDKAAIKVGDKVIVSGQLTYHNQKTPEFAQGSSIYSLNGQGGGSVPAGEAIGSLDNPKTCAEALALINALDDGAETDGNAYVKGKVVKVTTNQTNFEKYGNLNYWISDDGSETNQIQVYSGDGLNGEKFKSITDIGPGDEVVVFGKLYKYVKDGKMTPEINKGNYLVKYTKGSGGGGGETPSTDAKKVTVAEFNAAEVNENVWYQLTGTVENLKDGDQYGNFDLKDETGSVYVYGLLSEKGGEKKKFQDLAAAKGIKNGSKITIIGTRGVFNDKIEVMNAYFVSIEGGGNTGDDTGGQVSGNSITFSAQGYQNQQDFDGQSITLGDAKLSFSKGSGSTTPKYYSTGTAMRLYGGNTLTISSSKTISKVEFTYCEDYNGTSFYPTADNSTVTPGTYDYSTHTWTGSANEIVLSRSASTGHFRIVSITITYAK
jgi:RPA family protein